MNKYHTVVGLELHCELKTNSKVFSPSANNYNEIPNINVNEIDLSFPGIMPSLNKEAVKKAIKMALVLGCNIPDELLFDRKNYYYPDLPKGFQITQVNKPIGTDGVVSLVADNHKFDVSIHDIHLEEDTASLDHYDYYSLIDYNRCGVPLIEIVTNPCFHSASEAVCFLEFLSNSFKYCDISEADTKKGQLRCDVNVNLQNDNGEYISPKVEIKNINSFSNVALAIDYEANRQASLIDNGKSDELVQETRRFDETSNTTIRMRVKVEQADYKYFVEPNIPRIKIDEEWIKSIKEEIPMLPNERVSLYMETYHLNELDAKNIARNKDISDYYNECLKLGIDAKIACNWITSQIMGYLNKENIKITDFFIDPAKLFSITSYVQKGKISSKQAKEVFNKVLEEKLSPDEIITKYNMQQLSNDNELETIITNILDNNPNLITEYHNGRSNIFDYFVGTVMKETRGKANPVMVKKILTEKLK